MSIFRSIAKIKEARDKKKEKEAEHLPANLAAESSSTSEYQTDIIKLVLTCLAMKQL